MVNILKLLLTFLLLGISSSIFSQSDTLVTSAGEVRIVSITKHYPNGKVEYSRGNKDFTIRPVDYITFKTDGMWYEYNDDSKTFQIHEKSPYPIHENIFSKKTNYNDSPLWRVQVDLISPLINVDSKTYNEAIDYRSPYDFFTFTNRIISADLSYQIHDKLILNFPLRYGLNSDAAIELNSYGPTNNYGASFIYLNTPYYYSDYLAEGTSNFYTLNYYNQRSGKGHSKHLVMQAGISPKFYPFGQVKNAIYIGQTLALGVADYKAIDYFVDYEYSLSEPDMYSLEQTMSWTSTNQRAVQRTNQFTYFIYEALVGIDFNFHRNFALNLEIGINTIPRNKGDELDNVYLKTNGADYELLYSEIYNVSRSSIHALGRLQFIYKF